MAQAQSIDTGKVLKNAFYIAGGILGFIALKKIAEMFGLIQTQAEKEIEAGTEQAGGDSSTIQNNPYISFNPNYSVALIKAFRKKYPKKDFNAIYQRGPSPEEYVKLSTDLGDAKGYFNDDEEKLYSVFRRIQTQYQLSLLSMIFAHTYKKDLLEYLKSFTSDDEMQKILTMVKNYPQYYTK